MPKKRLTDDVAWSEPSGHRRPLAGWQAAGVSLAVAGTALTGGWGAVLGAIVLAPVVHSLGRLRATTPDASDVGDLVAGTLGHRTGTFVLILQTFGFAMLAVAATEAVGLQIAIPLTADPVALSASWLWPLMSMTALAVLTLVVLVVPDRLIAGAVAVLATLGLLTVFYLALAVIATALTHGPVAPVTADPPTRDLAVVATLALVITTIVGFDVTTTRTAEVRSLARPMAATLGATAVLAAVVWYAVHVSDPTRFRWDATTFSIIASQILPDASGILLPAAGLCLGLSALTALLWAVTRQVLRKPSSEIELFTLITVVAVLAVARTRDWFGPAQDTNFIGAVLLFVVYVVVVEASARVGDSTVTWWARFVTPVVLAAVVVFPLAQSGFAPGAWQTLALAAALVAAAVAVGRVRPR